MARSFFSPDSKPDSHHTIPPVGKVREKANLAAGVRTPRPFPLWSQLGGNSGLSRAVTFRGPWEFLDPECLSSPVGWLG